MPELAKRKKEKLVQFPTQTNPETHITMSEDELQQMIQDIVTAARKKNKKKNTKNF